MVTAKLNPVANGYKNAIGRALPRWFRSGTRTLLRRLAARRYAGGALRCPFCGGNFSRFLPAGSDLAVLRDLEVVGAGYRPEAVCPRCHSKDRERLVYLYLTRAQGWVFSRPLALLHIAPEPSLAAKLRAVASIDYVSADLDVASAERRMDITAIEEGDDRYDVIICNHVLEHVAEDGKAMAELCRVLKRGGFAILQVPISYLLADTHEDFSIIDPADRERAFGQNDHVRIYGRDYPSRLERAGFSVSEIRPEDFLSAREVAEYRVLPKEKLYVCGKA